MPLLTAFSGLPGVGKTTVGRAFAGRIGAVYLRIDTLEASLKTSSLRIHPAGDAGYGAAAAVARDNLALGLDVVADSVNPIAVTRALWAEVAVATGAALVNVEIVCSDADEHRRRVETRRADIPGLQLPDWEAVRSRDYVAWETDRLVLDTARLTPEACVERLIAETQRLR